MEDPLDTKLILENFYKELLESPLLNIPFNTSNDLDIIASNSFFNDFLIGEKMKFSPSLFSKDEQGNLIFNSQPIKSKERYKRDELLSRLDLSKENLLLTCYQPINQEKALQKFVGKEDLYLTYGNFYYQERKKKTISSTPMLFFKVELGKDGFDYYIKLKSSNIIYNLVLIAYLKREYNINLLDDKVGFSPDTFIQTVKDRCHKYAFDIDPSFHLTNRNIDEDIRRGFVLVNSNSIQSSPLFNALIQEELSNLERKTYPCKNEHLQYIKSNLNALATYPLLRGDISRPEIKRFLKDLIDEYLLHRESMLIITSESKREKWKQFFESNYYDTIMPYRDIDEPGQALFTLLESKQYNKTYFLDSNLMVKKEKQRELLSLQEKDDAYLRSSLLINGEDSRSVVKNFFHYIQNGKRIFNFDNISDYDFDDTLKDNEFVSFLEESHFGYEIPFTSLPYYGLNSKVEVGDYSKTISFLVDMEKDITAFEKVIEDSKVKTSKWSDFNSIRDYDDAVNLFSIYSEYEDYPLEYFGINYRGEVEDDVKSLQECYRKEASIKLSFDVLCKPEIWKLDFNEILNATKNSKEERKLKSKLKDIVKITPFRRSYKTLIILVDKYVENRNQLEMLKNKLYPLFKERTESLDGLLYIDEAFEFIDSYSRHRALFDHLSFENDFTFSIFNDKEFAKKYREEYYPALMEKRSLLEHELDHFHSIFNEDKFDYTQASFSEIKNRLQIKINSSEEEFNLYLDFSKKLDNSSRPLREAILLIEEENGLLNNFINDYMYSIYRYMLYKSVKENDSINIVESKNSSLLSLYKTLKEDGELLSLDSLNDFVSSLDNSLERPSYSQTIERLKVLYHKEKMITANDALKRTYDIFFSVFPLICEKIDNTAYLNGTKFDLVIIDFDEKATLLDYFYAMLMGKKALFLSKSPFDERVGEIFYDITTSMRSYSELDDYPEILRKSIELNLSRQNIQFFRNYKVNDIITIPYLFIKDGKKYALKIVHEEDEYNKSLEYQLNAHLYLNYDIITTYIYPLDYLVYPELCLVNTYMDVKEVLKRIDEEEALENKLSYNQKKKKLYKDTLSYISSSFPLYLPGENTYNKMHSSTLDIRPIRSVSVEEIKDGILTYLNRFTYLSRETLIGELALVLGTDSRDVDFRMLYSKGEESLISEGSITKDAKRISLIRK